MNATKHKSPTTSRVLKALSVFGGVQVISILCSVARNKLTAVWIGPTGIGLLAIYNSLTDMMTQLSLLNVPQSGIRELTAGIDDSSRTALNVSLIRRLLLLLGIVGMALMSLLSPLLSHWTFGDSSHTGVFVALSLVILLQALFNRETTVMRGLDRLRPLARCSALGSLALLAVSVPLIYFMRLDGIVPMIISGYCLAAVLAYVERVRNIPSVKLSLKEIWRKGHPMLSLGLYLTASTVITMLASNIFIIFLRRGYGDAEVGLYQAGYTLVNTYVGMIFTSISMEYYPRLSAIIRYRLRAEVIVSHEIKVAMWVLMPVAVVFVCCSGLIIDILYSADFTAALPFIIIGATGVFFRAVSWCMAFAIVARGDGKIYMLTEAVSAAVYLAIYIPFFDRFGFMGLGIGYVLWYFIYMLVVYAVYRRRYGMRLRPGIISLTVTALAVAFLAVGGYYTIGAWLTLLLLLPPSAWVACRNLLK
ncbi:MAG: oligosaccharide flippase family protein [Muribaculaceae bacterium]|nr:oligosaccharide flippase family protein [Muribaculaceae bacterium]